MAGNYRSGGNNIGKAVSNAVNSVKKAKDRPRKQAASEGAKDKAISRAKDLVTHKQAEQRKTISHRGKVAVKTAEKKKQIRKGGSK